MGGARIWINRNPPVPSGQPSGQSDVQNPAQVGSEHICIRRGLGMILKKVHVPRARCDTVTPPLLIEVMDGGIPRVIQF